MSEVSSYNGSASEADESNANPRTPNDGRIPNGGEEPQGEPKRVTVPRRPKLDADRVLDNRNGVSRLVEEMRKLKFRGKGHEVADLDTFIHGFEEWARVLYPYGQNILDFARTVETELAPQKVRSRLLDYRQDYVKELSKRPAEPSQADQGSEGPEAITQEELMRKKDENRRKALEKLKQKEVQKNRLSEPPMVPDEPKGDAAEGPTDPVDSTEEIAMDVENQAESDNILEIF